MTSRGLDESEKRLATQLHNQLRAKLARGEEIRGHPGPQPSASNMMQMASVLLYHSVLNPLKRVHDLIGEL